MDAAELIPGFKFYPTHKQLLQKYLKPKLDGEKLPCDRIKEMEIYGPNANPWEIFNDSTTQWITCNNEKFVYIFTSLTKIAGKESSGVKNEHNVRKAGCGTWHNETGSRPIMEGKNLIGHTRMLVFQINDINGLGDGVALNQLCYWKMHEYFLDGIENYVVCQITIDKSKKPKVIKSSVSAGSKANKKITSKDDRGKAMLIKSPHMFKDVMAPPICYENQRCHEENNGMMIHQNLPASKNSVCRYGSVQESILNYCLPQYDDHGNFRGEEQKGQGLAYNDGQRLNYVEQPVIHTSGNFENQLGIVLSDFNTTERGDYSCGLSYENIENNGMMIYENKLASTNSVCDQGLISSKNFPQYDNGGNCRFEEQEGKGLEVNNDQRLNYAEEAGPVTRTSGDFENGLGTVLSDFKSGPDDDDDVYLDLEDLFGGGFWSDKDNVLQEQLMSKDGVSLNFENVFDIGSWSELKIEKSTGKVNNNVQQEEQQLTGNMSCMLGKRESFEAQEDYSGRTKKCRF